MAQDLEQQGFDALPTAAREATKKEMGSWWSPKNILTALLILVTFGRYKGDTLEEFEEGNSRAHEGSELRANAQRSR